MDSLLPPQERASPGEASSGGLQSAQNIADVNSCGAGAQAQDLGRDRALHARFQGVEYWRTFALCSGPLLVSCNSVHC